LVLGLLGGCADGEPPQARILGAQLRAEPAPVLEADLRLRFSAPMLEALDRGIPLALEFRLDGRGRVARLALRRHLELRYLPLAQQYQIRDRESGSVRRVARRTQLFAALDRVHLPLPPEWRALAAPPAELRLRVALDDETLPGPLRLPALVSAAWRLRAPEYAWFGAD
jgi:hypothetical protein